MVSIRLGSGVTVASAAPKTIVASVPSGIRVSGRPQRVLRTLATLVGDGFSESATASGAWLAVGDACLTAGTSATPATSIPACGTQAPLDANGQGALQLTPGGASGAVQSGMVVATTPISTATGFAVTFTDYSFGGSTPGGDGVTLFFSDASQPIPTAIGGVGGSIGYANATIGGATTPGISNAYLGLALDEYGNYSTPQSGRVGGPGPVPETIALRGSAATGYQYIGGASNNQGIAASLPFSFDQATATSRPGNAPTVNVTLTPAGVVTASVDVHDGNGFVEYYSQSIVGTNGQPGLPANLYVGLTATSGAAYGTHQIGNFSVATLAPQSSFTPIQIPGLAAWYDASLPSGLGLNDGLVTTWKDLSGSNNAVTQKTASLEPAYTASGINGLGSVSFSNAPYLVGTNAAFSSNLLNESSVFVVSSESNGTTPGTVAFAGSGTALHWTLRLSQSGASEFDLNNGTAGALITKSFPSGPALWSALGSESTSTQILRKNGSTIVADGGPGATASGKYPLSIGASIVAKQATKPFAGQIGEILMFDRLLSATEAAEVEGYLACKWGLQNRLPANHPYANACPQGGSFPSMPLPAPKANALVEPVQIRSQNGLLTFNVVASASPSTGYPQLTYNGSAIPPTLRLLPGDTLVVNLTNNLPTPPAGAGYLNDTNIHYHGLHGSPNAPGDDSIDMMAMPGQTLHYQVQISPSQPTGLYWYHSHAHGESERQNLAGMSGALIVDGIAASIPQVANLPERTLIVRDVLPAGQVLPNANRKQVEAMFWAMQHGNAARTPRTSRAMAGMSRAPAMRGMMSMDSPVRGNSTLKTRDPYVTVDRNYRRFVRPNVDSHCVAGKPEAPVKNWTLNDQTNPSIGIRPGEQQFWRLVNAGSDNYLDVAIDRTSLQVVALDGVPLATPMTVSHYVVPPSSRIEFIVTGPAATKTTAYLRTNCFDAGPSGPPMPAAVLAAIDSTSSPSDNLRHQDRFRRRHASVAAAAPGNHGSAYFKSLIKSYGIARTQTLTYSDQNTINGQSYDPAGPPQFYAQSGTLEQWQIVNNSSQNHTFHIHQVNFLVQSIVGGTAIEQQNVGQVVDNVDVPPATANGPGSVTVVVDFTDPSIVGEFLLHCHILAHEDAGMMAKIRVGLAPPLTTNAPPNGLAFASNGSSAQNVTVSGGQQPYTLSGCAGVANASVSGNVMSVTPTGAGNCVVTVADASGLSASVAVTVAAAPSPLAVAPSSLGFTSTSAPAQAATVTGGTPPYTISGCQNIAAASVSNGTLAISPVAPGTCAFSIADSAGNATSLSVSINAALGAMPMDNLTFHQSATRQGWYQAETTLTAANVGSANFGKIGAIVPPNGMPAFGKVYAQPLYVTQESIGGKTHNLVIIATSTDQVYAYDDQTGNVVWETNFTNPAAGITQQFSTDTTCNDVNPNVGITGTPVIDRTLDRLFVVVPTKENGVFHQRLHAISLQNGTDAIAPVEVSASVQLATGAVATTDPEFNFNRSALLEANGNIYIGLGAHCDFHANVVHGWLLAYTASSLQPAGNAVDLTNLDNGGQYFLGSIWMSGFGPASDAQGNVYAVTGNGPFDGVNNFSMSALKLPGSLLMSSASSFTPATEATDSAADGDLGSGGAMLLPDAISSAYPHLMVIGGKMGATGAQKYLLNRDNLGGQQANDAGAVWHAATNVGIWGGPAFFGDASGNAYVVYGGGQPLSTYLFNPMTNSLSVYASANVGCLECRTSGSQPIVSSNGTTPGTAVIWALQTPGNNGGTISLFAFNAMTMAVLYSGAAGPWTVDPSASYIGGAFVSPLVANGRVYVPTDGSVAVFGL